MDTDAEEYGEIVVIGGRSAGKIAFIKALDAQFVQGNLTPAQALRLFQQRQKNIREAL